MLKRGEAFDLRFANATTHERVYFLGVEFSMGSPQLLFFRKQGRSPQIIYASKDELQSNHPIIWDQNDVVLAPSDQCAKGVCAAHATAAFVLRQNSNFSHQLNRQLQTPASSELLSHQGSLIREAMERLYEADSAIPLSDHIQRFLEDKGLPTKVLTLYDKTASNKFLEILRAKSPVIVSYAYGKTTWSDWDHIGSDGKELDSLPRSWLRPTTSKPIGFHLALAVGVLETEDQRFVLVSNSATGAWELWNWQEFEVKRSDLSVIIYAADDTTESIQGLSPEARNGLAGTFGVRAPIVSWIDAHSAKIERIKDKNGFFAQVRVGDWILLRRHYNYLRNGRPEVVVGQVQSVDFADGHNYLIVNEYSHGGLRSDPVAIWDMEIMESYSLRVRPEFP